MRASLVAAAVAAALLAPAALASQGASCLKESWIIFDVFVALANGRIAARTCCSGALTPFPHHSFSNSMVPVFCVWWPSPVFPPPTTTPRPHRH
jgi:hypothetical protein